MRYAIRPLDENGDPIDETLSATDDEMQAKTVADTIGMMRLFGVGIVDNQTGQVDVGFGFGVPNPGPQRLGQNGRFVRSLAK